ncbi:hypothetical protein ACTJJ7_08340 [Phyllobacterium sp. 22229]|uniref:hypothetical protein n=1 Tax=Phyllobacterium sp. 22229 TaxID=3453895 RepID=UPI003F860AB8
MRTILSMITGGLVAIATLAGAQSASALPLVPVQGEHLQSQAEPVYWRHGYYGWHDGYYYNGHRGYGYYRPGYRFYRGYWFPLEAFGPRTVIIERPAPIIVHRRPIVIYR